MFVDWLLASFHHLAVFSLAAILSAEIFLTAGPIDDRMALRLARIDAWFGIMAALVVAAGVLRVFFGAKGYEYYFANIFFWAKMGLFVAVGLAVGRSDIHVHRLAKAGSGRPRLPPAQGRDQAIAPGPVCRGRAVRPHSALRRGDGARLRDVRLQRKTGLHFFVARSNAPWPPSRRAREPVRPHAGRRPARRRPRSCEYRSGPRRPDRR